jgi:hypothetical protein
MLKPGQDFRNRKQAVTKYIRLQILGGDPFGNSNDSEAEWRGTIEVFYR